jgi:hypothetical protein
MKNATEIRLVVEGKKQGQKIFFHFAFIARGFKCAKEVAYCLNFCRIICHQ